MKRPFTVWNLKVAGLVKQFSQSYTAGRQNWQICDFTCKTVHSKFISLTGRENWQINLWLAIIIVILGKIIQGYPSHLLVNFFHGLWQVFTVKSASYYRKVKMRCTYFPAAARCDLLTHHRSCTLFLLKLGWCLGKGAGGTLRVWNPDPVFRTKKA